MPTRSFLRYLKPSLTEQFRSPLAPAEVLRRVQASLAAPPERKWLSFSADQPLEPFRGTVGPAAFEIKRVIDYRNDMLPRIRGWVTPDGRGSTVQLQHQLHPFVMAFGSLWLFIVGFVAFGVAQLWFSTGEFSRFYLIPFGMLVFGICLLIIPFWLEVSKSRSLLIQLLTLEETAT